MQPPSSWLSNWRDIAGGLESSFTAAALVIGALWTYLLFVRRRLRLPRAGVTHQLVDLHAGRSTVLHVSVRITNIGEVLIRMTSVMMRGQQLVPIPAHIGDTLEAGADPVAPGEVEIGWPVVAERTCTWREGHELEIEPGETEECHFDLDGVIADVRRVCVSARAAVSGS